MNTTDITHRGKQELCKQLKRVLNIAHSHATDQDYGGKSPTVRAAYWDIVVEIETAEKRAFHALITLNRAIAYAMERDTGIPHWYGEYHDTPHSTISAIRNEQSGCLHTV